MSRVLRQRRNFVTQSLGLFNLKHEDSFRPMEQTSPYSRIAVLRAARIWVSAQRERSKQCYPVRNFSIAATNAVIFYGQKLGFAKKNSKRPRRNNEVQARHCDQTC
jgi:hypothetical protein